MLGVFREGDQPTTPGFGGFAQDFYEPPVRVNVSAGDLLEFRRADPAEKREGQPGAEPTVVGFGGAHELLALFHRQDSRRFGFQGDGLHFVAGVGVAPSPFQGELEESGDVGEVTFLRRQGQGARAEPGFDVRSHDVRHSAFGQCGGQRAERGLQLDQVAGAAARVFLGLQTLFNRFLERLLGGVVMSFDVEVHDLGQGGSDFFQALLRGEELDSVFVGQVEESGPETIELGFFGVDEDLGLGLGFEELSGPPTILKTQIHEPLSLPIAH